MSILFNNHFDKINNILFISYYILWLTAAWLWQSHSQPVSPPSSQSCVQYLFSKIKENANRNVKLKPKGGVDMFWPLI